MNVEWELYKDLNEIGQINEKNFDPERIKWWKEVRNTAEMTIF